jgi:hypothetical protein
VRRGVAPVALVALLVGCVSGGTPTTAPSGDGGSCPTLQLTGGCAPCMQASCPNESAAALGAGWATHDFTGGACSDLVDCYCACGTDRGCVDACDQNRISAGCRDALTKLDACTGASCGGSGQCGKGTIPDAAAE